MANRTGVALAPRGFRGMLDFDLFRDFEERMRQFFGTGLASFGRLGEENWSLATWAPACDIYETDNEIVIKAELPEVKKDDVHVSIENNLLTIRGERKFSEETKRENYHRLERRYGEFIRSFALPSFADAGRINAEFKDGMLRVTLPKREEAKPKQIEVKVK